MKKINNGLIKAAIKLRKRLESLKGLHSTSKHKAQSPICINCELPYTPISENWHKLELDMKEHIQRHEQKMAQSKAQYEAGSINRSRN